MTEQTAERLARAIRHWLNFQSLCGREALFAESYLTQPVGEFLMSAHRGPIVPEWTIPGLTQKARGRPRQLDYVLLGPATARLIGAIEAKWVASHAKMPKQRLVDDLLRLERLRDPDGQHVFRYLLVAGPASTFEQSFLEISAQHMGKRRRFVPRMLRSATKAWLRVEVEKAENPWRDYFIDFAAAYDVALPIAFKTKLIVHSKGGPTRVSVWRVASNTNRATFKP